MCLDFWCNLIYRQSSIQHYASVPFYSSLDSWEVLKLKILSCVVSKITFKCDLIENDINFYYLPNVIVINLLYIIYFIM